MDIESLRTSYDEAVKYGFHLKEEYVSKVLDPNSYSNDDTNVTNGTDGTVIKKVPAKETFATVKKRLLEMDLRQHMRPYFPLEINSSIDLLELTGPVILQIISVGNITQPLRRRDENTQPRMLSIQVSDGTTKVTGIEIEHLPDINANTPPGGKILFLGGNVRFGKLLFTPQNFKYIGGVVDHLQEAYHANKIVQKLRSIGIQNFRGLEGPPQFEIKLIGLKTNNQKIASVDESNQSVNKADNNKQKHDNTQKGNKQKNKVGKNINQSLPNTDALPAPPTPQIQHDNKSNDKNHSKSEGFNEHLHERGGRDSNRNSSRGRGGRSDRGGGRSDRSDRSDRGGGRSDRSDRGGGRSDRGGGRSDRGGGRSHRNDSSSRGRGGYTHNTYPPAPPNETISFLENDFPALSINTKSKGSWVCSQCTFSNHEALQSCEICNFNKF